MPKILQITQNRKAEKTKLFLSNIYIRQRGAVENYNKHERMRGIVLMQKKTRLKGLASKLSFCRNFL